MVHPLAPGLMVFVSKGQPYDVALVMGCGKLFVELTVGLPEDTLISKVGLRVCERTYQYPAWLALLLRVD